MSSNVTKLSLALMMAVMYVSLAQASIEVNTGVIGFTVNDYGRISLYTPMTDSTRQLYRVTIVAALSEDAVCDYYEDHGDIIEAYKLTTPTLADSEVIAAYDNQYSGLPPKLTFKLHVYAWNNEPFLIAQYTVRNDSSEQVQLYLGLVTIPNISQTYGGETVIYNADHCMAYCYREEEVPHAGIRLLSAEPYSYKVLDWPDYSEDPDNDAATDSTRYHMTADAGFDADMIASGDGSIFSLNAGSYTIAAGDSVTLTYAVVYAENETDLFAASDDAQSKYDNIIVSVDDHGDSKIPAVFSLAQNYPNPFNPATTIRFNLETHSDIHLAVYNLQGQLVNEIASGMYTAGSHSVEWDGRDSAGENVSSGVYIYHLTTGNLTLTKKMLFIQ